MAALVGGDTFPRLGEISLVHNGVVFLDELPGFQLRVLDALRAPLKTGEIYTALVQGQRLPSGAFSTGGGHKPPSPSGDRSGAHARCGPAEILCYLNRLSGPFLEIASVYRCRTDGQFLENALMSLELSVRAWHRLKVTRTLADLAGEAQIS